MENHSALQGLIIDMPYVDQITSGQKIWEMRSTKTTKRGHVALIRKGTGMIVGLAEIIDSVGPLTRQQMSENQGKHMLTPAQLADPKIVKWNNAWVLRSARKLRSPIRYQHPNGAVIWVNLTPDTQRSVMASG